MIGRRTMPSGADIYRRSLRGNVRGLWTGAIDYIQFMRMMRSTINRRLKQAWLEGAAACGISEEELTPGEWIAMDQAIVNELGFVEGFADDIEMGSRASGGKLKPLHIRVEMWANRYKDVVNRAKQMACADRKLLWHLGATVEHCRDCLRYNGRVHRGSTWARYEIRPQSPSLACHGFRCACTLEPTDERAMPGRPPGMTG
jgi:hypothetical protein